MSSITKDSHPLEQISVTPTLVRAWASANANSFIPPSDKTQHSFCYAFHPKGFTPAVDTYRCARYAAALEDPNMHFFVIRDVATSEYVGCTRWLIHPHPEPFDMDKEIAVAHAECRDHDDLDGGISFPTIEMLRIAQAKAKAQYLGDRAYVYLWILGTVEWAQGKGVGAFALRWGMQRARELGLPVYLESTEQAVGFYERQGFRRLGELDYDARRTGFHRKAGFTAMIWEPEWETKDTAV